jgi:hypothetical protein
VSSQHGQVNERCIAQLRGRHLEFDRGFPQWRRPVSCLYRAKPDGLLRRLTTPFQGERWMVAAGRT